MSERPSLDRHWLNVAKVISDRSTCTRRKVGAVLVQGKLQVGAGYNGSARDVINCDEYGHCLRAIRGAVHGEEYADCVAVHAEENVIINTDRAERIGATMYVYGKIADGTPGGSEPCYRCKRKIINSQIARVVCLDDDEKIVEFVVADWADADTRWYRGEVEDALRKQKEGTLLYG